MAGHFSVRMDGSSQYGMDARTEKQQQTNLCCFRDELFVFLDCRMSSALCLFLFVCLVFSERLETVPRDRAVFFHQMLQIFCGFIHLLCIACSLKTGPLPWLQRYLVVMERIVLEKHSN